MLHVKFLCLFSLSVIFSLSAFAQNLNETHSKILSAIEKRDYQTAVSELKNTGQTDKKAFEANNYDYLLARLAEKNNDTATAAANYQTVINRNSVLSEYALWHLSQIARSNGNLMLEKNYLRQILTDSPSSLLANAAYLRLTKNQFESGNYESAIDYLKNTKITVSSQNASPNAPPDPAIFGNLAGSDARTRENLVLLAQSYLQSGKQPEAREVFTRLITNLPNSAQPDDFALAGARGLDELDGGRENLGKIAPQISDGEHYRRALIYQFNRDFSDARLHFTALAEQFPQSSFAPDAMYQTGRGFVQEGNYDEAIKWFERVQAEYAAHPISRDALSQAASAYSRVNKTKEAISRYQKFIDRYPGADDNPERAFLNIVDIERDLGRNEDALKWVQKTRESFKGKLPEALAVFDAAKIHISQNDWTNALADLDELLTFPDLGGTRVAGGTNKTEIIFLRGFVLEQLQKFPEAINVYLSIPDGRGEYYGWRSSERLKALANNEKTTDFALQKLNQLRTITDQNITAQNAENIRQATQSALRLLSDKQIENELSANMTQKEILLGKVRQAYALLPAYQKIPNGKVLEFGRKEVLREKKTAATNYHQTLADELLFLGLYDEGTSELEAANKAANTNQTAQTAAPNQQSNDVSYTLAVFYKRGDMANRAVAFAEPLWRNVPADYQIELIPRDQIELLYPAPYADSLLKYAPAKNVDPRFILSIMRQESRYRADVKSYAAARGLMQFISDTSNRMAVEIGRQNFTQDELYNPPTAVQFGSQYLADLFKQFPNQPPAVAGAYNGGESNVARWLARAKTDDADRYVPEIVFSQSKDYVYKVMTNYRIYQFFYKETLN